MVLAAEVRELEVAHLHEGEGADGGEGGVHAGEQPWEFKLEETKSAIILHYPSRYAIEVEVEVLEIWTGIYVLHISSSRSAPKCISRCISFLALSQHEHEWT
jgi:hypothetical protein